MKTFSANAAKTRFGEFIDLAQREPMRVTRRDRVVGVLVSAQDYESMRAFFLTGWPSAWTRPPARQRRPARHPPCWTSRWPMKADARAVVDTHVLISPALLATSVPAWLVRHLLRHGRLLFSEDAFNELEQRLWRPKFDRHLSADVRKALLHDWAAAAEWVPVHGTLQRFSRDPDDDKFIHAAVAGRADVPIGGDGDLLGLAVVSGVPILPPAHVLNLLARLPRS